MKDKSSSKLSLQQRQDEALKEYAEALFEQWLQRLKDETNLQVKRTSKS